MTHDSDTVLCRIDSPGYCAGSSLQSPRQAYARATGYRPAGWRLEPASPAHACGRPAMQPAAARILEMTRRVWREPVA